MGGDNPRDAAHSLVGKFMTHIYHSNACPETNDFADRTVDFRKKEVAEEGCATLRGDEGTKGIPGFRIISPDAGLRFGFSFAGSKP
jgi:hypothetical protein